LLQAATHRTDMHRLSVRCTIGPGPHP
jgi:hypothetical protein